MSTTLTNNGIIDEAEGIWSADIEQSFLEALAIYPPCGRRKIILTDEGKLYGRNELVARYIKIRTGKIRTRKQVSSHLQVLSKRRSKDLHALRNDKQAQQVILDRIKQYKSTEIIPININDKHDEETNSISSSKPTTINTVIPVIKKSTKKSNSSLQNVINNSISNFLPTSPVLNFYGTSRSPNASYPNSVDSIHIPPLAVIGDENFRLYELSAFIEIKPTISSSIPSPLLYPYSESGSIYQHDLLRLHTNDSQIKNLHTFETISIDQIFDKFPRYDGLKDLFEGHPDGSFFLIKFWADVSILNSFINREESFFTSYTYTSNSNRSIHISTRLCSFGKQVLEKVETSEHPQRDQFDQFMYRFDRSPLCDYMVQFIQKLRSLPNTSMMNSVLENFTILQAIKYQDDSEQLLLCLAFVFEIAMFDTGGSQYQVYKLVAS